MDKWAEFLRPLFERERSHRSVDPARHLLPPTPASSAQTVSAADRSSPSALGETPDYVEAAVREGLEKSPWEELKEQAVLGGQKFVQDLIRHVLGDEREQRAAKRLAVARPAFASAIGAAEKVKGEKWEAFRERYGCSLSRSFMDKLSR
jgi:hypothetical protein